MKKAEGLKKRKNSSNRKRRRILGKENNGKPWGIRKCIQEEEEEEEEEEEQEQEQEDQWEIFEREIMGKKDEKDWI